MDKTNRLLGISGGSRFPKYPPYLSGNKVFNEQQLGDKLRQREYKHGKSIERVQGRTDKGN